MNVQEFSKEFDLQYDNIASRAATGLNEYEKSVFLTRAQEDLIRNYFDGTRNLKQAGLDTSLERQIDFSEIIKVTNPISVSSVGKVLSDPRARIYRIEDRVFFILNESVEFTIGSNKFFTRIFPISYNDLNILTNKAYPEPPRRSTWRLIRGGDSDNTKTDLEIIPHSKFKTVAGVDIAYVTRYVKKPQPIVLNDFESDPELTGLSLTVDSVNTISECELNPLIHPEIVKRAVELAKASYQGDLNSFVQVNDKPV